jgi:8-oxo-dGTP diphosphatase
MPEPHRFAVTVDLLVFVPSEHGPALLCVQRAYDPYAGCWALPGGFVDEGEDLAEAAARELYEETGLQLGAEELVQFAAFGDPGRDPRGQTITIAFIALLSEQPLIKAGDDAAKACFWPIASLLTGHGPIALAFDHEDILRAAIDRVNSLNLEGGDDDDDEDDEADEA